MPVELEKVLASFASKMELEFRDIQLQHRGMKGETREIIVKEFLERYLPKSLGIGKGEIVSSTGQVSKQMDIVIYDALRCPVLYKKGEIQVFPSEGVYAVMEVKSKLDSKTLLESIENIISVKILPKVAYVEQKGAVINTVYLYGKELTYFPTMGMVFAFNSIDLKKIRKLLEKTNKEKKISIEQQIDMICVLKKGVIFNYNPKTKILQGTPDPDTILAHSKTNQSLLLFYLLAMPILTQVWMRPIKMTEYAKNLVVPLDYE